MFDLEFARRIFPWVMLAYLGLGLIDLGTTYMASPKHEINPLARVLWQKFGFISLVLLKLVWLGYATLIFGKALDYEGGAELLFYGAGGGLLINLVVCINNLWQVFGRHLLP